MDSLSGLGGLTIKELGRRVWRELYSGKIFSGAAELSYYFFLALFPLLLFLTTVLGYFAGSAPALRRDLIAYLQAIAPPSSAALMQATIDEISSHAGGGKLSLGLLGTIWAASNGVAAVSATLNAAYGVRESRPWWRVRLMALALTVILALLVVAALTLFLYGGEIGKSLASHLGLGHAFSVAWRFGHWVLALVFVVIAFALIYYFAPDAKERKWHWITPGSLIGVVLWLIVSYGFRIYLHFFDAYSLTYGSLEAVIILMLWFYLSGASILIGGEIDSEIARAAAAGTSASGETPHSQGIPAGAAQPRNSPPA